MLSAGFAEVDITPPADVTLQGYEFRFSQLPPGNDGVHDPLLCRALAVHDGNKPAVILSLDICIVSVAMARHLRTGVAERVGTTPDRVLVCTTHTHSGPDLDEPQIAHQLGAIFPQRGAWSAESPGQQYAATLPALVEDAAARAAGLVTPVRVRWAQAGLGIGYNRRVSTPDGVRQCWNPQEQADLCPDPAADPSCTVVVLEQTGGPRRYLLWSLGAHPTVLGKTSRVVSADYPGLACRLIDQDAPDTRAMFLLGAAGDVHPWIATQEDPAGVHRVAESAASFVTLLSHALRPASVTHEGDGGLSDSASSAECGLRIATRTVTVGRGELDLAAWNLGGVLLLASPTELFSGLSAELRQRVGRPMICATCANGWTGYWPTREAFDQGSYEIDAARQWGREPGDSEKLVDELADLAREVT